MEESLHAIELALEAAREFNYLVCAENTKRARLLAEEAFSHPSILAQLNFGDQHKMAMYLPLFLPAGMTILLTLASELKRYRKRKHESLKWLSENHAKRD